VLWDEWKLAFAVLSSKIKQRCNERWKESTLPSNRHVRLSTRPAMMKAVKGRCTDCALAILARPHDHGQIRSSAMSNCGTISCADQTVSNLRGCG
jgi:hypothetical protein